MRGAASPAAVRGDAALHLYRIAQEAVMNAVKAGKAKRISVRLTRRSGRGVLSVTDNGVGLREPPRRGMGLMMMSHRARVLGALFGIRSRPRGTTRVTCVFPADGGREGKS
jgi:signal transduction histidine kinase